MESHESVGRRAVLKGAAAASVLWPIANAYGVEREAPPSAETAGKDEPMFKSRWRCAVKLDSQRNVTAGSNADLAQAIGRGADLQVQTEFIHNEHIDTDSDSAELGSGGLPDDVPPR